jgi:beta-glucosidase/6-phospho-beta-glucosidase/beta-galactosidase
LARPEPLGTTRGHAREKRYDPSPQGDIACDHYHRAAEDVALMADLEP